MPDDLMRYDRLAQHALRGVVRDALRIVERTGLPGDHHFYIAFNTTHPGVNIGERMMARYPREMTIVLQHKFLGLKVTADHFEVELFFDDIPEKLIVPFDAVKGFLDPAVQFGLQFETVTAPPAGAETDKPKANTGKTAKAEPTSEKPESEPKGDLPKVVSLDSFRKK
ncbi:MAG: hypothetical protein H7X89_04770 [Rhizobiales bacterium]|nr:hypothetical protein [Hyphomicrobiales bacterium]